MSSVIQQIFRRIFPAVKQAAIFLGGSDSSGKTTILYRLKLDETVTTIPTIGFNVETCKTQTKSGVFNATYWDVGGCGDRIRPLMYSYMENVDALIWVIDASNKEYFEYSLDELLRVLADKKNATQPLLLLANKQDNEKKSSVPEIIQYFSPALKKIKGPFQIFPVSATVPLAKSGLPEALQWLKDVLTKSADPTNPSAVSSYKVDETPAASSDIKAPGGLQTLSERVELYLLRAEKDMDSEEFYQRFLKYDLPEWDHYTHVRLAFIVLTKFGRQKGKDILFEGINSYITNASNSSGRKFHVTMTYFWIQLVHFGIRSMPPQYTEKASFDTVPEIGADDFSRFLLINPYVADGQLWADYYSKEVMMTPKAKEEMVLPDKKPLPNLVSRETVRGGQS